jgi:16S rRNA processing protein RimM
VVVTVDKPVVLGRISGLFGVRGWVRIHSYTEPREGILDYVELLLERDGKWTPVRLMEGKRHGKTVVARLAGVEDRDEAATLVNFVGVSREDLPKTEEGEYYWSDLEGLQVVDTNGDALGRVAYLLETGANDVLVVQGEQEILIPFLTGDVIEEVDLATGVIKVSWEWD